MHVPSPLKAKAEATRLLLMVELATGRHATLRSLAEPLEVTVQAVSDHLRRLSEEGLVSSREGFHAPTRDGTQWLHARLREMREFVSEAYDHLRIIDTTTAIAGAKVSEGDRLGLFMEDGRLVCHPKRASPSQGRALASAEPGQDVPVGALEGVVDLTPGTLTVLLLPGGLEGGSRRVPLKRLRQRVRQARGAVIALMGPVAQATAARADLQAEIVHAPIEAASQACATGRNVLLLASTDEERDLHEQLAAIGRRTGGHPTHIERL